MRDSSCRGSLMLVNEFVQRTRMGLLPRVTCASPRGPHFNDRDPKGVNRFPTPSGTFDQVNARGGGL